MDDVLYMVIGYYLEDVPVESVFEDKAEAEAHAKKLNLMPRKVFEYDFEVQEIPFKKKKSGK